MPSAARRERRRRTRERERETETQGSSEAVPPFPDLGKGQSQDDQWEEYHTGEQTTEASSQTECGNLSQYSDELEHLRRLVTYYETGADDDKDDQEDYYHDDPQSEGDDWKLTEEQRKEIAYLNTLSPEELRLLAEMDYSQFSDGDEDKDENGDKSFPVGGENNWLNELD